MERDSVRDVDDRMPVIIGARQLTDHHTPPERSVAATVLVARAARAAAADAGLAAAALRERDGCGVFRLDG